MYALCPVRPGRRALFSAALRLVLVFEVVADPGVDRQRRHAEDAQIAHVVIARSVADKGAGEADLVVEIQGEENDKNDDDQRVASGFSEQSPSFICRGARSSLFRPFYPAAPALSTAPRKPIE